MRSTPVFPSVLLKGILSVSLILLLWTTPLVRAQWIEKALTPTNFDGHPESYSVDLDGDLAAVVSRGKVHLFERSRGGVNGWGEIKTINLNDMDNGYAYSMDLHGDLLLVGSPYIEHRGLYDAGAAYLFARNEGGPDNWGQVKVFTAGTPDEHAAFGKAVALSGDVAFIAAPFENVHGRDFFGFVYVYNRHAGGIDNWGEVKKLEPSMPTPSFHPRTFGYALAASGDRLLVGFPQTGSFMGAPGEAILFDRHAGGPNAWGQIKKLISGDSRHDDGFGYAVALDGDDALVAARDRITLAGSAYVFHRHQGGTDNWGQVKRIISAQHIQLRKESVALRGDMALVGASIATPRAAVYRFARNRLGPNNWGLAEKVRPNDPAAIPTFGLSVAIDKEAFLVGLSAVSGVTSKGVAYLYRRDPCPPDEQPPKVTRVLNEKHQVQVTLADGVGIRSLDFFDALDAEAAASEPEPDDVEHFSEGLSHYTYSGAPPSLNITIQKTAPDEAVHFVLDVQNLCDQSLRLDWPSLLKQGPHLRTQAPAVQLSPAYPNPFNPETRFTLSVAETQPVTVTVYDVLGRVVARLYDGMMEAHQVHTFTLDAGDWASGTYLYEVSGAAFRQSRTFVLLR